MNPMLTSPTNFLSHHITTMKKIIKIVGLVLLVLLFIGTFVFLYRKSQPTPITYELHEVKRTDISRTTIITGTIEPRVEVDVKPQISGIVAELYKEAGQSVKKGEVIARIKVVPEMSQLNSAENRVRLAHLTTRQAQNDFNRTKTLYDQQLVSTEEYEKALLTLRQQKEELATANDALNIIKDGISASMSTYSTTLVRSTIDGTILDIPIKVGNSVTMSNTFNDGTTIATVANMSDLIFKGSIDETEVAKLFKGMPMDISIGAYPDSHLKARLEFVAPKAGQGTSVNQFEVKGAILPAQGLPLRAGYSANAEIILESRKNVISIPEAALTYEGKDPVVYVLTSKDGSAEQTFERRVVRTGLSDGLNIEILSGLHLGEKARGNETSNATPS